MKLLRFRVTKFRSVTDSGWIDADDVTALIGTNESGKTNLMLPLWKLNPAKGGEIKPTSDFPRKDYHSLRALASKPTFIRAQFSVPPAMLEQLIKLTGAPVEHLRTVEASRQLDGQLYVDFPDAPSVRHAPIEQILEVFDVADAAIAGATPLKAEEALKSAMLAAIAEARAELPEAPQVDTAALDRVLEVLAGVDLSAPAKRSTLAPAFGQLSDTIGEWKTRLSAPGPVDVKEARDLVARRLPKFVYYSNYGNLDSEIYLPHVIENMERDDLGAREEAQARTLKVLFDFVQLKPTEILELGRDFRPPAHQPHKQPTEDELHGITERKRERGILLSSASTDLTKKFLGWWKQGDYRFRFEADGDHFRIMVSDDRRPDDIELENRSTGLQWFLSFFLVFLVESGDEHSGAILLLDEPGLSLHPLAQRDLSQFFDNLSLKNQLIYTTHSPFLVDADRLDRVRAVFVNEDGSTGVSTDLRAGERALASGATPQQKSIYPVYAALNLTAADTLLQGCEVVIVEGPSDQIYLSAIKNLLIGAGRFQPKRDVIFLPAGGVRGVGAVASVVSGTRDGMPPVLLDGDGPGTSFARNLKTSLYQGTESRVYLVTDFVALANAEIEDLIPLDVMRATISRWLREPDQSFDDVAVDGTPVVRQIESYADAHGLQLAIGWKVDLARQVRPRLVAIEPARYADWLERWAALFNAVLA